MPSKIRVFVSSTMKDLANERAAVVQKISDFNFEPVNAEGWLPSGASSWSRIEDEINSSHLFVLILGDRYGWIPDDGPGAGTGLSVTHMEARHARKIGLPILPFLKRLDYESPRDTADAKERDKFRKEVEDWAKGLFKADFELAVDLSRKVGAALVGVLSESFLKTSFLRPAVFERAKTVLPVPIQVGRLEPVEISSDVVAFATTADLVLLAGAGISMSAGYPSAQALVELLHQEIAKRDLDAHHSTVSGSFQDLADAFVAIVGRPALEQIVKKAMDLPQEIEPSQAHMHAVRRFKTIVTTNYDSLFERAATEQEIPYRLVIEDADLDLAPGALEIVKLDGSITEPGSLVMSASDAFGLRRSKPRVFAYVTDLLREKPLLVVGHSLRDINIKQIINGRKPEASYYIAPDLGHFESLRLQKIGFRTVNADALTFFESLGQETPH